MPVKIMRAESKTFMKHKYMGELDMTVMFTLLLVVTAIASEAIRWTKLLPQSMTESNLVFYLGLFVLAVTFSTLFKTAIIGGMKTYET